MGTKIPEIATNQTRDSNILIVGLATLGYLELAN